MDEQEIIKQAKLKDETAIEKLVITYKPLVEKLSFQFGIKPEYIPDIVQETFIKVYQNIHHFHRGKFSTWLYQITLNTTRDFYRKKQRDRKLFKRAIDDHRRLATASLYFENVEHVLLHEAIKQLDEKYRIPLILFYFHDQTYEEIAFILKLKMASVKTRMHRGRGRLKELYEIEEREERDADGRQTIE